MELFSIKYFKYVYEALQQKQILKSFNQSKIEIAQKHRILLVGKFYLLKVFHTSVQNPNLVIHYNESCEKVFHNKSLTEIEIKLNRNNKNAIAF